MSLFTLCKCLIFCYLFLCLLDFINRMPFSFSRSAVSHQSFARAKSTTEKVEAEMKYVNNKDTRTKSLTSFWCIYCQHRTYFTIFFFFFFVYFKQNVCWVDCTYWQVHLQHFTKTILLEKIQEIKSYWPFNGYGSPKIYTYLDKLV